MAAIQEVIINMLKAILNFYNEFIIVVFCLFLFGVLSFGRAFSVLCIGTPAFPLFVTELVLILSLPFIFINYKAVRSIDGRLLIAWGIYFLYGCFYMALGLLKGNLFALRDVTLFGYTLFFLLSFIIFSNENEWDKILVPFVLFANFVIIMVSRMSLLQVFATEGLKEAVSKTKVFHFGLHYGVIACILLSLLNSVKDTRTKLVIKILLTLDVYMLVIFGNRSIWLACLAALAFFILFLKTKLLKNLVMLLPFFIIILSVLCLMDFGILKISQQKLILSKAKSFGYFITGRLVSKRVAVPESAGPVNEAPRKIFSERVYLAGSSKAQKLRNAGEGPLGLPAKAGVAGPAPRVVPESLRCGFLNILWRLDIWEQSIAFGMKSPLWGRGFGVYPEYLIWGGHAPAPERIGADSGVIPVHNYLITIFYKMGILGLALFLYINIFVLYSGIKYVNKCRSVFARYFLISTLGACIFWHTMAFFFDVIDSPPTSIFIWILMGMVIAVIETDKNGRFNCRSKLL
ncbi:MAG: O-antigen ligase family protein [Candidatus Omnitrophota bacterium]